MWEYGARAGPGIPSIPGSSFTSRLCGRLSYRPIILEAWRQEGKGGKKGMKERKKRDHHSRHGNHRREQEKGLFAKHWPLIALFQNGALLTPAKGLPMHSASPSPNRLPGHPLPRSPREDCG